MRKFHGNRFILALAFFLLTSGGFLFFQVWGIPRTTGSASALEVPLAPPTLGTKFPKKIPVEVMTPVPEEVDDAADPDPSENTEDTEIVSPVVEPKAPPPPTLSPPQKTREIGSVEKKVKPTPVTPKNAAPPKVAPRVEAAEKTPKPVTPETREVVEKPKSQPKYAEARGEPEEFQAPKKVFRRKMIETSIPPEWNWFSEPLKAQFQSGKLEVFTDFEKKSMPSEMRSASPGRVIKTRKAEKVAKPTETPKKNNFQNKPKQNHDNRPIPFLFTLERMKRGKSTRKSFAQRENIVLPSEGNKDLKLVPASLIRLIASLKTLTSKDNIPATKPLSDSRDALQETMGVRLNYGESRQTFKFRSEFLPHPREIFPVQEAFGAQ